MVRFLALLAVVFMIPACGRDRDDSSVPPPSSTPISEVTKITELEDLGTEASFSLTPDQLKDFGPIKVGDWIKVERMSVPQN